MLLPTVNLAEAFRARSREPAEKTAGAEGRTAKKPGGGSSLIMWASSDYSPVFDHSHTPVALPPSPTASHTQTVFVLQKARMPCDESSLP